MADRTYCVHAGEVVSQTDGQRHYVSAPVLARLYELRGNEWHPAPSPSWHRSYGLCVYPSYGGNYGRENLPNG